MDGSVTRTIGWAVFLIGVATVTYGLFLDFTVSSYDGYGRTYNAPAAHIQLITLLSGGLGSICGLLIVIVGYLAPEREIQKEEFEPIISNKPSDSYLG